jgi:hypothetical protein
MRITFATAQGVKDRPNEDFALATSGAALVIDGAGGPAELGSGCIHGTPWYVKNLAMRIMDGLVTRPDAPLTEVLAQGITQVTALHTGVCDLQNPGSPSATIALVVERERIDYLVLSDAVLVLDGPAGVRHISDRRIDDIAPDIQARMRKLRPGTPEHQAERLMLVGEQRRLRNRPGGHWVAATLPEAAEQALTGSVERADLHYVALLSDGAARFVDFGLGDWRDLMALLVKSGPPELISQVRAAEEDDVDGRRFPRTKRYDDATALLATL